ncbi:MAG: DUF1622 domain-containing protein [Clostridiales bacterium]|nr:DUF1622 domain-containing protein [Clostridiales bacterium]
MLNTLIDDSLSVIIPTCELMGIFVVTVSALACFWRYLRGLATGAAREVKSRLAAGLALSLEFKMAAEILKTVQVRDLEELTVLGAVIVLRAVLSLLIHFEMEPAGFPRQHGGNGT